MTEATEDPGHSILSDPARLNVLEGLINQGIAGREDLDDLARLTAFAFKAPICVISLVSDNSVRFVGNHGLEACEVALENSLCTEVVRQNGPIEVLNLSTHPELSQHPAAVNPPYVRAYCGQPLISPEGLTIGAVAVVDTAPFFRFSDEDREALIAATNVTRRLMFGDQLDTTQSEAAE